MATTTPERAPVEHDASGENGLLRASTLAELQEQGVVTATGQGHTIAVFWHNERAYAVDNRCPHMGFPLARGICEDGVLTCYWHYARFDLDSGGAFDIWAGDVRTYPVTVRDNAVYVDLRERQSADERYAAGIAAFGEGPGAGHCAQPSQGRAGLGRPEACGRERSK